MSGNGIQRRVLVTGGAGYVGSRLVPKLVDAGHNVTVLDLYLFGDVFSEIADRPGLRQVRGDIRDAARLNEVIHDCDAVIHLACISNDPSFELDPVLGKSINLDAFQPLVRAAKDAGVRRFIYASSSSVYGVRDEVEVTEDLPLRPLTEYSKYKAECEDILDAEREPGFVTVILRPAAVCGYARRLRLDLTVNILTNHAINNGRIRVFGGSQKRPNINIEDMTDLYVRCLDYSDRQIDGGVSTPAMKIERCWISQRSCVVSSARISRSSPNRPTICGPIMSLRQSSLASLVSFQRTASPMRSKAWPRPLPRVRCPTR